MERVNMFQIVDSRERGGILRIDPLDTGVVCFWVGNHSIHMRDRDLPGFIEFLSNLQAKSQPTTTTKAEP